jgi:hypothetical protein
MRIAYLECFSGMSGDMFMGALVDAGVPSQVCWKRRWRRSDWGTAGNFSGGAQRDFGYEDRCLGGRGEGFAA